MIFNKVVLLLGYLVLNAYGISDNIGVQAALQSAVNNGGNVYKLGKFIADANYYFTSDLNELQKTSLLASNIIKLYPDPILYYTTLLNSKMVIYLDKALVNGDVNDFMKYAVEVMTPNNGFNSSGAQEFFDDIINENIPAIYDNFNNGRDVIEAIIDYVNIDSSISDILFWLYDNSELSYKNPNLYFKELLKGLLNNFVLPDDAEELGQYILNQVTIASNSDEVRPMIRDFLGSKYIPDSINNMVDEITMNEANWKQFTDNTASAVIPALEWKYAESELSDQFRGTQWEDEFNYVQRLISNYILYNFTAILYIDQPGGTDYLFNQIGAFVNTTNIRDGYKDLYTILLKLATNAVDDNDLEPVYNELESFLDTTDIINDKLKDALSEFFQYAADYYSGNTSDAETLFWLEAREYVDSLNLASTTRTWFEENIQQTNMTSFHELDLLFYPRRTVTRVYNCGSQWIYVNNQWVVVDRNCTYISTDYGPTNMQGLQNFLLLLIDIADKDDNTFGDFTGPFWPNNLIENANRVASTFKYAYYNNTEEEVYRFTNAILLSITDMYKFEYPYNALLNISAQILPKLISEKSREYYFPYGQYVNGYYDYSTNPARYIPGYYVYPDGHAEEFVKEVLVITENTLDTTLNMRDLIDTAQLYVEMNTFNVTTFNGVIDFICDQTKDITKELCTVFEMVNATINLVEQFAYGIQNFTYKESITDIKNTFDLPEFLPFLEDFVDAAVSTFYPNEGATIISAISSTYDYWITPSITTNEIVNLIESVGNLYIMDDDALENEWKYTILYVKQVLNSINTTMISNNTNIDNLIGNLTDLITTSSPTETPKPTMRGETISPTQRPTTLEPTTSPNEFVAADAPYNYYCQILLSFVFLITFLFFN